MVEPAQANTTEGEIPSVQARTNAANLAYGAIGLILPYLATTSCDVTNVTKCCEF
jgi:hypothetical protein